MEPEYPGRWTSAVQPEICLSRLTSGREIVPELAEEFFRAGSPACLPAKVLGRFARRRAPAVGGLRGRGGIPEDESKAHKSLAVRKKNLPGMVKPGYICSVAGLGWRSRHAWTRVASDPPKYRSSPSERRGGRRFVCRHRPAFHSDSALELVIWTFTP